jgi:hypothetical protein
VTNSLADLHPDLAAEWHPTLNGKLTPDRVVAGTAKPRWWKCPVGPDHEWEAPPQRRVRQPGCPFCTGNRISVTNSLATLAPDVAAEWHPTLNGDLTPHDVTAGSRRKVWWRCALEPDHEWPATVSNRTNAAHPTGCPACAPYGYDSARPAAFYLLAGDTWGKVGITNHLDQRLKQLDRTGLYGPPVMVARFAAGSSARTFEGMVLAHIAAHSTARTASSTAGYTESFPVALLGEVIDEVRRLLSETEFAESDEWLDSPQ